MKRIKILTLTCLLAGQLSAQHLVVSSGTQVNMSGNVYLVLDDISLTNEATIDGASATLNVASSGTLSLKTSSELNLTTLNIGNAGGNVNAYGAFVVTNFSLPASDNFTLSDTSSLTLSGTVDNPGSLILASGASLFLKGSVPSVQSITLYRNTTFDSNTGKYSIMGSPLASNSFSVLVTNAQSWIYEYDESEEYGTDGSGRFKAPEESTMTIGKGYFSAFTGDETGEVIFTGIPTYKNLNYPITLTDNATDASEVEGFNLLSNPFTCPLSFSGFATANTSVLEEETIWIWDDIASDAGGGDATADYITINSLGNTDSQGGRLTDWDGTINVAQGFFVKAASSGNVVFNQTMKTNDGNDDDSFYRKAEQQVEKYWFEIRNGEGKTGSNTLVGFHPDATNGLDSKFDATRFGNSFSIYTVLDGRKLAIQGLPGTWTANSDEGDPIAFGFNVEEAGEYSISTQRSEYASGVSLYLNDREVGTSINITQSDYTFQSAAGSYNDRFSLTLSPLTVEDILALKSFNTDVLVYGLAGTVNLKTGQAGQLAVWSIDGRLVALSDFHAGETIMRVYQEGIYLVSIETKDGVSSYKVKVGF